MEHHRAQNVVGAEIRRLRYSKNLTQDQLAARCCVAGCEMSRGTLAKIEAQIRGVSDTELFVIAKILGVKIESLFPEHFAQKLRQPQR